MSKKALKAIIVIVEGETDEALLIERLKELYVGFQIKFEVRRGDIFYYNKSSTNIKNLIGDFIKGIMIKTKYKPADILAIIHVLDTDGCMIPEHCVEINNKQVFPTIYANDKIIVNSNTQKNEIVTRNKKRTTNINTMNSVDSVVAKKYNYQAFYFSRTLEHVIFNEPNPNPETKYPNIDNFINELTIPIEDFLTEFLPPLSNESYLLKYKKSWNFIAQETNSLKRYTNVPLLFTYLNEKIEENLS